MADGAGTIDREAIDELLRMVGDDREFLADLIDTYLEDAPKQLAAMREAVAADDPAALVRPAHTLKSNSRNLGATALAELSRELESMGEATSLERARDLVDRTETEFGRVRSALEGVRLEGAR